VTHLSYSDLWTAGIIYSPPSDRQLHGPVSLASRRRNCVEK